MERRLLHNVQVLVLEDDYYLATDLQVVLETAGAQVMGPFSNAVDAGKALAASPPDCALVDLNLGRGISFELPYELARQCIPFAFVTGYDRASIPDAFAKVIRVEKPFAPRKVTEVTERLLSVQRT